MNKEIIEALRQVKEELRELKKASGITPRYLRETEAAKYVGLSVGMMRKLRFLGDRETEGARKDKLPGLPFVKVEKAVMYDVQDLDNFMVSRKTYMSLRGVKGKAA